MIDSGDEDEDETENTEETLDVEDENQAFTPEPEKKKPNYDPYPSIEKKREILAFYRSAKKAKSLDKMKRRYPKLNSLKTIYNWEKQIATDGMTNF